MKTSEVQLRRRLIELAAPLVAGELWDEIADSVFFIKDSAGRYVVVNATLVERCGRKEKAELLGKTVSDVFPRELAESYAAQDRLVLERGVAITRKLELHLYPTSKPGWCLTHKHPLRDASGRVLGLVGLSRDVHPLESAKQIPASLIAAVDFLHENFGQELSVEALAQRAELPPVKFSRLVKRIFNVTPSQLILQARLQEATRQLRETHLGVAEISHDCGFYDHSTFCRHFKSATGLAPQAYREAARAERLG